MNSHARGLFITVEGIDRSGKTTQCRLIADEFAQKGARVELLRYPGNHLTRIVITLLIF